MPPGDYDVTLGFKNPWSGRSVNIIVENLNVSGGDYEIGSDGAEKSFTKRWLHVADGQMTVRVQGPSTAAITNYNDSACKFDRDQTKRDHSAFSDLQEKIADAKTEAAKLEYSVSSVNALKAAIADAEAFAATVNESNAADVTIQEALRSAIVSLNKTIGELFVNDPNTSFKPGQIWRDTNGEVIQAHGGGILFDQKTQTYYWYGEDKTNGYLPARGVGYTHPRTSIIGKTTDLP